MLILFAMRVRVRLTKQLICNVIVTAIFLFYLLSIFFLTLSLYFSVSQKGVESSSACTVQVILCIE